MPRQLPAVGQSARGANPAAPPSAGVTVRLAGGPAYLLDLSDEELAGLRHLLESGLTNDRAGFLLYRLAGGGTVRLRPSAIVAVEEP